MFCSFIHGLFLFGTDMFRESKPLRSLYFSGPVTDLVFNQVFDLKHSLWVEQALHCHIIVCFDTNVSNSERTQQDLLTEYGNQLD